MAANTNLQKAKATLILDQPFFASILLGLPMIEDSSIKTLSTNGDWIRYNPEFLNTLSLPETLFVLAHETLHCVLQHMHRRGNRDGKKWNVAGDYIINDTLVTEKIGIMPHGCLLNPSLVQQGNGTTEGVYNVLPDSPPKGNKGKPGNDQSQGASGNDDDSANDSDDGQGESQDYPGAGEEGGALDDVQDAGKDEAEISKKESEMRVKIVQAANAAKMAGKLSAGLARIVGEMTETRTDWKAVLRRFFSDKAKTDLSYAKPKRRFLADDIYLPSLIGEKLGEVVIAVDCSASITEKVLSDFGAEINAIVNDTVPALVRVIYFDSQVLKTEEYTPEDTLKLSPIGGGGTAFSPVFEYLESQDINPVACVFLTDLECDDFGNSPAFPVLWASIERGTAPFGEVLYIKES